VAGATASLARRIANHHGLANESGVRVRSIEPGSPAASAGLESGDLIVLIDDEQVTGIDRLQRLLDHHRIGRTSVITILRRAQKLTMPIVAQERPRAP
jgi:S1-C subfamily serine protease